MLLDQYGNTIEKPKEDLRWMPYEEYIVERYFLRDAKITQKDYELAAQYISDKKHNLHKGMTFKEWLEKKANP